MSWRAYIYDTITGAIRCPVDIPSFSWSMSVSDSTLSTTRDKGVGAEEASGLKLPWGALPARSAKERAKLLCQDKRGIMLCWATGAGDPLGTPIIGGAITPRTDTATDTSFTLESPLGVLSNRYIIDPATFGAGDKGTTTAVISYRGLSRRGLAAEFGARVTDAKTGGRLPIDWNYQGEQGAENRDYHGYDVQNLSFKAFLTRLTNLEHGPDCQFRPKLNFDKTAFRWDFLAGSDADIYLEQDHTIGFAYSPWGGSIEDLTVDHTGPIHRRYVTGSGTGKGMKCALAEDLTLVEQSDPWPLREAADSDNDIDDVALLQRAANGLLAGQSRPIMQIKGVVHANDVDQAGNPLHPLGSFWPGERVLLDVTGFPTLDDGRYETRLMLMEGDESDKVTLTFDVMDDPML